LPRKDLRACQQEEKTPQRKTTHPVLTLCAKRFFPAGGGQEAPVKIILIITYLLPTALSTLALPADLVALCHPLW